MKASRQRKFFSSARTRSLRAGYARETVFQNPAFRSPASACSLQSLGTSQKTE
ncbi:MAG: hypothetical protein KGZ68_17595 [Dechloromonas sp.]|nr:hypothetical protein [Dechloromonas sp.]